MNHIGQGYMPSKHGSVGRTSVSIAVEFRIYVEHEQHNFRKELDKSLIRFSLLNLYGKYEELLSVSVFKENYALGWFWFFCFLGFFTSVILFYQINLNYICCFPVLILALVSVNTVEKNKVRSEI